MKGKKYYGIGAVVLLILVAISPAISGMQLKEAYGNLNNSSNSKWDLKVTFKDANFMRLKPDEDKVVYLLEYVVENIGTGIYWGKPETILMPKGSSRVLARWSEERFGLLVDPPNDKKTFIREVEISCENEQYIAGLDVELETGKFDEVGEPDPYPGNNRGESFGEYWDNQEQNGPTKYQLRSTVPKDEWIDYVSFYNVKLPKFNSKYTGGALPSLVKSNRLGWVETLATHLDNITKDIFAMIALTAAYVTVISPSVVIIANWLSEVFVYLTSLANGMVVPGKMTQLINKFINNVWPEIQKIIAESIVYFGAMIKEIKDFVEHTEAFKSFLSQNPWDNEIKVEVKLYFIDIPESDRVVRIKCRDYSKVHEISTSTASVKISVSSQGVEDDTKKPHNCSVTVELLNSDGSVKRTYTSKPVLSYVFSEGKLFWSFTIKPRGTSKTIDTDRPAGFCNLLVLLREWFNTKPFSKLFFNFIQSNGC